MKGGTIRKYVIRVYCLLPSAAKENDRANMNVSRTVNADYRLMSQTGV